MAAPGDSGLSASPQDAAPTSAGGRTASGRRGGRGLLWVFGALIVAVAVGAAALNWDKLKPMLAKAGMGSEPAVSSGADLTAPAIPVKTVTITEGRISDWLRAVGNLYPDREIEITPPSTGFLVALPAGQGSHVKKGDVLLELDSETAAAELANAKAQLQLDQQNYNRIKGLVDRGYGAVKDLEQAQAKLATSKASITRTERTLEERQVLASFDGVIGRLAYSVGAFVSPGDVITKLWNEKTLYVDVRVPESSAARIRTGMVFDVQDGISEAVLGNGVVTFISPEIDTKTRSVLVRGEIPNADDRLRPGLFIAVSLTVEDKAKAIVVPSEALVFALSGTYVFKVVDGKAQRVAVEIGIEHETEAEILSGVAAGDVVITEGRSRVRHGMPVRVVGS